MSRTARTFRVQERAGDRKVAEIPRRKLGDFSLREFQAVYAGDLGEVCVKKVLLFENGCGMMGL